ASAQASADRAYADARAAGKDADAARAASDEAKSIARQKRQDEIAAEAAKAAQRAKENAKNNVNPADSADNDKVDVEQIRQESVNDAADAATYTAKVSSVLGIAAVAAACIPGGQLLAGGLAGASLVFAGISALYNAKAYGWGSSNFVGSVAGIALTIGLGSVGSLAASQMVSKVGKTAIKGVHDTVSSVVGWFTA
ncbi:hypothetical protein ACFU8Q_05990, partial [Streptomyces sp. NPDC057543]